jgi:hypothetical protein
MSPLCAKAVRRFLVLHCNSARQKTAFFAVENPKLLKTLLFQNNYSFITKLARPLR